MKWTAILLCLALAGCTVSSDEIRPVKKGEIHYAGRSCQDLQAKLAEVQAELKQRSELNDSGQGGFGNVGKIGDLKGEEDAITAMLARKKCA